MTLFRKQSKITVAQLNTEAYRSGHNGPDSKSGSPHGLVGSNPTASAIKKESSKGRLFPISAGSGGIRRRPYQDVCVSAHRRYKQSGGLFVGRAQIELFNYYNAIMRDVLQKAIQVYTASAIKKESSKGWLFPISAGSDGIRRRPCQGTSLIENIITYCLDYLLQ